jgi:hypothetical protein
VRDADARAGTVGEHDGQAVGRLHDADPSGRERNGSIGARRHCLHDTTMLDHLSAVHLIEPQRLAGQFRGSAQPLSIREHGSALVADVQREVEARVRSLAHAAAGSTRRQRSHA